MKSFQSLIILGLILTLTLSCSTLKHSPNSLSRAENLDGENVKVPEIGFDPQGAYYPLRVNESGEILPSFQYRYCAKKALFICLKWKIKREFFPLDWFYLNDFVLIKRPKI